MKWVIIIKSKENLPSATRDFMTEVVSEEARKTIKPHYFVLHNVLETKKNIEIIIEGTEAAFKNLLTVLKDNFSPKFRISSRKIK